MTLQALVFATLNLQPSLNRAEAVDIAEAVDAAATITDTDAALLLALAFRESSLRRTAVNKKTGAAGLMAIHPVHLTNVSKMRVVDVAWNALCGARLLRAAIDRTGSIEKGLSRFNGRRTRSSPWVRGVLALAAKIRQQWSNGAAT